MMEPLTEYRVFYVASDTPIISAQGLGSQVRDVQAHSHHEAVCEVAQYSEHSEKAAYLAVGRNTSGSWNTQSNTVARLFRLKKVGKDQPHDFVATPFKGCYQVTEIDHFGRVIPDHSYHVDPR